MVAKQQVFPTWRKNNTIPWGYIGPNLNNMCFPGHSQLSDTWGAWALEHDAVYMSLPLHELTVRRTTLRTCQLSYGCSEKYQVNSQCQIWWRAYLIGCHADKKSYTCFGSLFCVWWSSVGVWGVKYGRVGGSSEWIKTHKWAVQDKVL